MADSNTVKKRVKSASKQAVYYRNYRRARDRALVRLAQANPAQYAVFLKEERERDRQEGKAWADLAGTPIGSGDTIDRDLTADEGATTGDQGDRGDGSGTYPAGE